MRTVRDRSSNRRPTPERRYMVREADVLGSLALFEISQITDSMDWPIRWDWVPMIAEICEKQAHLYTTSQQSRLLQGTCFVPQDVCPPMTNGQGGLLHFSAVDSLWQRSTNKDCHRFSLVRMVHAYLTAETVARMMLDGYLDGYDIRHRDAALKLFFVRDPFMRS